MADWECPVCTFANAGGVRACEMCATPCPKRRAPAVVTLGEYDDDDDIEEEEEDADLALARRLQV